MAKLSDLFEQHRERENRAARIMLKMGFPPTETGPFVSELRAKIVKQVAEGLVNRSGGSWAEGCYERDEEGHAVGWKISHEERARSLLEMEWSIEKGHAYEVKAIDPPIHWTFSTSTMRRGIRVHWSLLLPWVGDRFRELAMVLRIRRGGKNPYSLNR